MNPKSMTRLDAMRRLACAVVLLSLGGAVTGTVSAEQGARLDDPWLAKLEGRWDLVREIRGEVVRNTFEARWVLNHQFLQLHMLDVATPPAYEALVTIGFDAKAGEYLAYWTDSWGAEYAAVGRGKRVGDAVEFRFDYPDGPFFNTFRWESATGRWSFVGENVDAQGHRKRFATDTLTRAR
jgi:hypothetical protein